MQHNATIFIQEKRKGFVNLLITPHSYFAFSSFFDYTSRGIFSFPKIWVDISLQNVSNAIQSQT